MKNQRMPKRYHKNDEIEDMKVSLERADPARTAVEPVDPLLSIGVFARRSRLSMKALRLYDRLGLLTPADVDPDSGYRRYRESQLTTARLVVMLRRMNMPLTQVAEVVAAPGSAGAERLAVYWLSAYDGVAWWVSSQGLTVAGSPREIYFTDFVLAGPSDEVCDVALPIR